MLGNIVDGFYNFFHLSSFLYMNLGILLGIIFGAIPGLTVLLCIVLFLPFTYGLDPIPSFMFLLGIYCAGSYGGSISAIMIKAPGTPHAAATLLDGAPLAAKGFAKKALKTALIASTIGGLVSAIALLFISPFIAKVALHFGPPEYFILCLFGLSIVAGVSGTDLSKGIISSCIGLFLATVGIDIMSGTFRFTFGNYNLFGGFDLVIIVTGLFAISETIMKAGFKKEAAKHKIDLAKMNKGEDVTFRDFKRMVRPISRSSLIGIIIGAIPGTGASMASFFSYDQARKRSKHPEEFGKGSIEGIAAAESANNAVTGATLIPLLTLGIPGDAVVAILVGAFMVNGLIPGPNLFVEHTVTIYAIMVGLIFTNVFMFLQGNFLAKFFAKVALIPTEILTPIIVLLCLTGAYSINNSFFDVLVSVIVGFVSYLLIRFDFSVIPVLLGLVLGPLAESNLRRSLLISHNDITIFFRRPISAFFIAILLFSLVMVIVKNVKKKNSMRV
ncbi:tripartite tricarboxylate transporter permease [Sediminispirochaeta smaragdinae]|uniref:DUF112 domain-containing protein n=1 Tax=Sediminispirochaeta smaragdinae (strain DSM 11293 / JCM 15392 / SEBR 4228) TaxID=573413 RepID=E1RBQ8_SEDSS|nr:tripartite tricarboxylate transporter permease [Sediminispirochaeta smaragdinae]ADK79788.1 protein of unknown function DUF112 transmembrane [Sediminispirochaeta smaragdinae DSM 11293]